MIFIRRSLAAAALIALIIISPVAIFAQGDTIVGSGIATPVLEAILEEAALTDEISLDVTGTTPGLEAFCQGEAMATVATRALSIAEEAVCEENAVEISEFVIGYDALAIVTSAEQDFLSCISINELSLLMAPSAEGRVITWQDVSGGYPEGLDIEIFLPPTDSSSFVLLDELVAGIGIRQDATSLDNNEAILEAVAATESGIGVVPLRAIRDAGDTVQAIEIRNPELNNCVSPDAEAVDDGTYPALNPLLLYVRRSALDENEAFATLTAFVASEDMTDVVEDTGFTAPTETGLELNTTALTGEPGRTFSREVTAFEIPPTVSGAVSIAGTSAIFDLVNQVTTNFNATYTNTTFDLAFEGEADGLRRLCNGEVDIIYTTQPLSAEDIDNCAANDIIVEEYAVGTQAVVLVANGEADYLACLTTEQLETAWSALPEGPVMTWSEVEDAFPETGFIFFSEGLGSLNTNLLMSSISGENLPMRADTEVNGDSLFRAAATANVEGAMTYMDWPDYQRVLENEQANIQLVEVDAGSGCVTPGEETILSLEYPISRTFNMAVSQSALERPDVQSTLWFLFDEQRLSAFENESFTGVSPITLAAIRSELEEAYEAADARVQERLEAEAAEAESEGTEEPDEEASETEDETPE